MKAIFSLIIFLSFCTIQIVAQTQVDYQPLKSAGEKAEAQLADAPKFALRIARQM